MNFKTCSLTIAALVAFACTSSAQEKKSAAYGDNIISISPLQVTDMGPGVSLSYERSIGNSDYVTLNIPVSWSFSDYDGNDENQALYFWPGVKIYPTGSKGVIRYAVGPNLTYVTGAREGFTTEYINGQWISSYSKDNFYKLGMMITNSMNINPGPRLHMSLELGFGFTYLDDNTLEDGAFNLVQFGFKAGYRF